jgi:hypothetical protein
MNEVQSIAIVLGIFTVLLMLVAWAMLYPSANWGEVASGVAGATVILAFLAVLLSGIVIVMRGRK